MLAAGACKEAALKQVQAEGLISDQLTAQTLHLMISALVTQAVFQLQPGHGTAERKSLRASVLTAVGLLSRP
ncbi:hypothetical protein RSal33209_1127 [Renibacterium salmoninarum ATCC 33209]|uniref:Transcriptional regulator, TetR family n=1 Tax=Renibacterium salmoninarum (strain ATCC 33209 / DSM 20767 / JCM 11484 / NBRC 15589 / NCIMB 2235) TaxID=288705 RepID=A9WP90_RENSM|nr:hypothetical protein [Renibacterium salmoninarum]ABY22865.1 hypothetical protein RSal33209_1127 [Renibacterium salmoninarum ATCC 33209]